MILTGSVVSFLVSVCFEPIHRADSYLIEDVEHGDVLVALGDVSPALQQVDDVGHGGGRPASSLVVELVEAFRGVGERVRGGAVLHPVSLLQE